LLSLLRLSFGFTVVGLIQFLLDVICSPLHLSHAADSADGGIALAVSELILSQSSIGLSPSWLTANSYRFIIRDLRLFRAASLNGRHPLHIHGLWRSPTRVAAPLAYSGLPIVVAPHGMLDPGALAISRRKKRLVWRLWEKRALRSVSCLHALCPAEASAIRTLLPRTPIAVIPNGVSLPVPGSVCLSDVPWSAHIPPGDRVLLFLGRFHQKKGIEPLLHAWQAVSADAERHGWWLALVGYGDNGALCRRVSAAQSRGELSRILVYGPAFGAEKHAVLSAASSFVLSSFSEGLPMAALEAMAYKLPCLLSQACNLPEAFSAHAALPAPAEPLALAESIRQLFALSASDRAEMGRAGQAHVAACYSWSRVAEQTQQLYQWILSGGTRPAFVEFS
jgi:glycosyltransferase involved in cell wall biosynthesis